MPPLDNLSEGSSAPGSSTSDSSANFRVDSLASESEESVDWADAANPRQRQGQRWIMASGLLIAIAGASWFGYVTLARRAPEEIVVATVPVERETLEKVVSASGVVELGGQQTLKAPSDVIVEAVLVKERQRVRQGDVLLVLRDRTLQQEREEYLIQQEIDHLNLARKEEIIQERERTLRQAEEQLLESQDLVARGFISEDAYNSDQSKVDQARAQLRDAQVDLQQAKLERQKNLIKLKNLQAKLSDNQIQAPFDAVILSLDVKPGEGAEQESPLLTIGDPGQEQIRFSLMTLDASQVQPNMPVRVSVIGPNATEYLGRVVWLSPQATGNSENEGNTQAQVGAIAILNQPSGELIPGSSVSLEIITQQRKNVLAIPLNVLRQEGDTSYVWIRDTTGQAQKRAVVLGLTTLESAEVISGLEMGTEIIVDLPPDQELIPGTKLETVEETGEDTLPPDE